MRAEIIAIGSELTTGARLDTNSQWLSVRLAELGVPVDYHLTVADDLDAIVLSIQNAVARSDIVLVTGGLGPTQDDLTRDAMAAAAGVELYLDESSLAHVQEMFARFQRTMPERNRMQALFPVGSRPIPNPNGTAPGIWMEYPRGDDRTTAVVAALPGVPSEMMPMFRQSVRPALGGSGRVIRQSAVNCFGLGESHVEQLLGDLTARNRDPEVGITAHEATITLRVTAHGATDDECQAKIESARTEIRRKLGHHVFGDEDQELQDVLLKMLTERRATLATAEWATGGLLSHRLSSVADCEGTYLGGLSFPLDDGTLSLRQTGHSSASARPIPEAAIALRAANACREDFEADYAIITRAGRLPADSDSHREDEWVSLIAIAGSGVSEVKQLVPAGNPAILRSRAVKTAMNLLRLKLLGS